MSDSLEMAERIRTVETMLAFEGAQAGVDETINWFASLPPEDQARHMEAQRAEVAMGLVLDVRAETLREIEVERHLACMVMTENGPVPHYVLDTTEITLRPMDEPAVPERDLEVSEPYVPRWQQGIRPLAYGDVWDACTPAQRRRMFFGDLILGFGGAAFFYWLAGGF